MDTTAHPHTQAVLDAWRRLIRGEIELAHPSTRDDAGLVGRLFVIERAHASDFPFRRAGASIEALFGRELQDQSFLSLWDDADRGLVAAAIESALEHRGPTIVRARGETLNGRRTEIEILLAPLDSASTRCRRILGLCQVLGGEEHLKGRPLHRMQAMAVYPPAPLPAHPVIRLVASNEN